MAITQTTTGTTTSLNVSELEFSKIKTNLVNFLKDQNEFTDFDFTGSNINVLLDLLAYTTQYVGVYANMSFNEFFLDTAKIRNNVISKAKELNYVPRQVQSSSALIRLKSLDFDTTDPANAAILSNTTTLTVPAFSQFLGTKENNTYSFVNINDIPFTLISYNNTAGHVIKRWEAEIPLYQGTWVTHNFTVTGNTSEKFILPSPNIDVNQMSVIVTESGVGETFSYFNTLSGIGSTSAVYFIQEAKDNKIEIYFGDGVFGKAIRAGSIIQVKYLITDHIFANGIKTFDLVTNVIGFMGIADFQPIQTLDNSSGGADKETISSIKLQAPRAFAAQERAVTITDYSTILINTFGFIKSVNVWGGETNIPAEYGSVFLTIVSNDSAILSTVRKNNIIQKLRDSSSIIGITPKIVDPEYIYIELTVNAEFEKAKTIKSDFEITSLIEIAILQYFNDSSFSFNSTLNYSRLLNVIDSSEPSIFGNLTTIRLAMIIVENNPLGFYQMNFNNGLNANSIISDTWTVGLNSFEIKDDGQGKLFLFTNGIKGSEIGSVDYINGTLKLSKFFSGLTLGSSIIFRGTPTKQNIDSVRQSVISINPALIPNSIVISSVGK